MHWPGDIIRGDDSAAGVATDGDDCSGRRLRGGAMGKLSVRRLAWRAATLGREGRGGRSISSVEVFGGKGTSGGGPWSETGSSMVTNIDQRGL